MKADGKELSQENGQESTVYRGGPLDFDFLNTQTFGDRALERDVLELFIAQARRILSTLSTVDDVRQEEKAHLIKGSARGIGAVAVAEAAAAFEMAIPETKPGALLRLIEAVTAAEAAIETRLGQLAQPDPVARGVRAGPA